MRIFLTILFTSFICLAEMPDPLKFNDGSSVENLKDWEKRRGEILEIIRKECFGRNPVEKPKDLSFVVFDKDDKALGGKAVRKAINISFSGPGGKLSFRVNIYIPKSDKKVGAFLLMCHRTPKMIDLDKETDNAFWPVERIVARGYAAVAFNANQVDEDKYDEFKGGVHKIFDKERKGDSWGTIAAWAWACSRVLDYLETDPLIDAKRVAVLGHSRGGKTGLWAGATDERFAMTISNNSGCSGAAIARRKKGESVKKIIRFKHWFCTNYWKYADNEEKLPFDSHMLIALSAPRLVYVASASKDSWADPEGEFEGTVLASKVYEKLGIPGLGTDKFPALNGAIHTGKVGYHLRDGKHALNEFDWDQFMNFADKHMK
jgi:hypothetical protein